MRAIFFFMFLLSSSALANDLCEAKFGKPFSFGNCQSVRLPGFEVRDVGFNQPNPQVKLSCWNYVAVTGKDTTRFQHCSTGVAGGFREFNLGANSYIVDMDVPICGDAQSKFHSYTGLVVWQKSKIKQSYEERSKWYQENPNHCYKLER